MKKKFDLLDQTLKATGFLLLLFLPFGFYYVGLYTTLSVFFGGVWGIINFIFISALVRTALKPKGINMTRAVTLAIIKFPMLYASGFFLLSIDQLHPEYLVIGFTSLFVVLVLKVLGGGFLSLNEKENRETV